MMKDYILVNKLKYCPKCDRDILGVTEHHDYCCWCGTKLEETPRFDATAHTSEEQTE